MSNKDLSHHCENKQTVLSDEWVGGLKVSFQPLETVKDSFLEILFDGTLCRVKYFYRELFEDHDSFKDITKANFY